MVFVRVLVGAFIFAHGLVHLLYLVNDVGEFSLECSWLTPDSARSPIALVLIAATVAAFAILALAVWGVPGPSAVWPVITVVACLLSMALLILFWNSWLIFGLAIDIALLAAAVIQPDWVKQFMSQH
jgi:hypothetical protein